MIWEEDKGFDVTSAFKGVTNPAPELLEDIQSRGWEPSVDFKNGTYLAKGKSPNGEIIEKTGPTPQTALGHLLIAVMRREYSRASHVVLSQWKHNWTDQLEPIAKAYAAAPIYDPNAAPAWQELAQDSMRRAEEIGKHIKIDVVDDPEPYKSHKEMLDDIHNNKHFYVSRAHSEHPVWSTDQNVAFRICHDVLGHAVAGGDFGWAGENAACGAHFPLLSPAAQKALFTECIGQTAYGSHYRDFGPQKVAFLDDFIEPAQAKENSPYHQGVHPSQTVIPTQAPTIPESEEVGLPWESVPPHMEGWGMRALTKVASGLLNDPNKAWKSNIPALPDAGYLWHGDPINSHGVLDTTHKLHSNWRHHDHSERRQAVANAFRSAVLIPRKPLDWGAIHSQHISHIPADVTDPKRFYEALDNHRAAWNYKRGHEYSKLYDPELPRFRSIVKSHHPHLNDGQIHDKADRELFNMRLEEEGRILADDKHRKMQTKDVEAKADKALAKRLKVMTRPNIDQKFDFGEHNLFHSTVDEHAHYEPFLASHCKTLAQLGHHIDRLTELADRDPGSGHHFRAGTLALGIPNIGPKEASFAWLMLNPKGSQLAVIDPHISELLGYNKEAPSKRDYFKLERQLAAGRDASGYGHLPLGAFGWGMFDFKRTPGKHQDYSAFKVIDPTPHESFETHTPFDSWQEPEWWAATQPARDQVGQDWDRTVAINHPEQGIPFIANKSGPTPVLLHPESGEVIDGEPGLSAMQHLRNSLNLSTEQVWELDPHTWKK